MDRLDDVRSYTERGSPAGSPFRQAEITDEGEIARLPLKSAELILPNRSSKSALNILQNG